MKNFITNGDHLPVCSDGERLQFVSECCPMAIVRGRIFVMRECPDDSWDGASIPRKLWFIFGHPLAKEFRWASYWHDRLCEKAGGFAGRKLADDVFLELLEQAGVSKKKRWAMWLGVRGYGILRVMRWM